MNSKTIESQQLKDKIQESTRPSPYEDLQLIDLPGEVWKPFPCPPFDDYYVISNKGRIKRLAYIMQRSDGIAVRLPERVKKQNVSVFINGYKKQKSYVLLFSIRVGNYKQTFSTARIIYYTFIEPFELSDPNLIVRPKDGNGLNCVPENLYLFERKNLGKWIKDNDRRAKPQLGDRNNWSDEMCQNWDKSVRKKVSQYDLQGRLVQTFNSRREAGRHLGIGHSLISAVIKEQLMTAGGFIWREGEANPSQIIDVPPLGGRRPQKVALYTKEGDLICVFPSIRKAAEHFNITDTTMARYISKGDLYENHIFKAVGYTQEPLVKISVDAVGEKDDCDVPDY